MRGGEVRDHVVADDDPAMNRAVGCGPRLVRLDRCPVCGHETTAFAFASSDLLHDVAGLFAYERCTACGSFFQNPRAVDDDLPLCYPDDYFTHGGVAGEVLAGPPGRLQGLLRDLVLGCPRADRRRPLDPTRSLGRLLRAVPWVRRRAMYGLVDELGQPADLNRCLELGPGTGDDMWRLAQLGWTVTGIDLDHRAAADATVRSGCPVVVQGVLSHRPAEPYGLIYGSHSIEHVPHIRQTVSHLRSLLGPRGRLVLILPNPRSLSSRVYGPLSVVWDPPRHLSLPSAGGMATLLRDAGFTDVRARTSSRRAGHYCAIARVRREGMRGAAAWGATLSRTDRALHLAEAVLVRLGLDLGEEVVVSATAP